MPELPEVETVRRDLSRRYVGDRLEHLEVTGKRTVRRHAPGRLATLEGHVLRNIGRHGKYLLFEWDDGRVLVAHLRMSGQLLAATGEPAAHTHAVFSFVKAGELHFVDPRTFGEFFLGDRAGEGPEVAQLAHLGPDALEVKTSYLAKAFAGRRAPVKSLLVDQRVLAGIGNIYADEILYEAKVRPDRPAGELTREEVGSMARSVRSVLGAAVKARGSTLRDKRYTDVSGAAGNYQLQHRAYGRAGQSCLRCGAPVERARIGAKSAYFCPNCQR